MVALRGSAGRWWAFRTGVKKKALDGSQGLNSYSQASLDPAIKQYSGPSANGEVIGRAL